MRFLTFHFFRRIHNTRKPYRIHVRGRNFVVAPGVFTPRYRNLISLKASELLAFNLRVPPAARVLDLGTGVGIQAVFAADRAGWVVGTDINPAATACARHNARANGVWNFEARTGDLFEPVAGERFDLIIWLPPSFFVEPRTMAEYAYMCGPQGAIITRFWQQASDYLKPGGKIQFSCVDRTHEFMLQRMTQAGFRSELIKTVPRWPLETVRQYLAWPS
jgi:HemK-related putative methylase